jgi:hypothetical protein
MSKEKQNYQDKLVELIEEETYLATGVKTKEHWSGDCNMNKILKLVEQEIERAKKEGYEEGMLATKILFKRIHKWNDEWRKEKPEERKLTDEDALRLIEWKIEKAKQEERERVIEKLESCFS